MTRLIQNTYASIQTAITGISQRGLLIGAISGVFLAATSTPVNAATLTAGQILTQFNAVITHNFTTGDDVEGRLVAGTIQGGATFYNNPNSLSGPSAFQAINAVVIAGCGSCNINNGGSVNFVTGNNGHFNLNGGGAIAQNDPSFNITDFTKPLDALATQLSGLAVNSTVNSSDPNNFTFNAAPNSSGLAVFSLAETLLASANNILFNLPATASTVIIDVTGAAGFTFTQNGNFNGPAFLNEHVIWNFEDAAGLNLKYWHGAVLAGGASVTNSSPIEGLLYANNFTGNGELHNFPFLGQLPAVVTAVPEPSGWAMMLVGFLAAGLGLRSRRRQLQHLAA